MSLKPLEVRLLLTVALESDGPRSCVGLEMARAVAQSIHLVRVAARHQHTLRHRKPAIPGPPYIRLQLFLPGTHPRRIMLLRDLDAAVSEQR